VARFYNVALAVAAGNPAVRQVAASRGATIAENARTFALLNMAISDALVSVMETKYHYLFWRPHTAILRGEEDGNAKTAADPGFAPYVPTPCFPSYPSAHASASYAARAVAARIFGERLYAITDAPGIGTTRPTGTTRTTKTTTRTTASARCPRYFGSSRPSMAFWKASTSALWVWKNVTFAGFIEVANSFGTSLMTPCSSMLATAPDAM
jgi:hypothetical protein